MMEFQNLEQLEKYLNKKIAVALKNEVSEVVKKVMVEKVEEEVYSVYEPKMYQRLGIHGGLADKENIDSHLIDDNTLSIRNTRHDGDKDVAAIVETGHNYTYDFEYNGVPRPFTEATVEELKNTNEHVYALFKGLQRQGISVQK